MVTSAGKHILKPAKFYPLKLWKERRNNNASDWSSRLTACVREKSAHGEPHLPTGSCCSIWFRIHSCKGTKAGHGFFVTSVLLRVQWLTSHAAALRKGRGTEKIWTTMQTQKALAFGITPRFDVFLEYTLQGTQEEQQLLMRRHHWASESSTQQTQPGNGATISQSVPHVHTRNLKFLSLPLYNHLSGVRAQVLG